MDFEWDERKNESNIQKHGISFYDAIELFEDNYFEFASDYAEEPRMIAVGKIKRRVIAIVYTWRGANIRIISARSARRKERAYYEQYNKN